MDQVKFFKVAALPAQADLVPNAWYVVRPDGVSPMTIYVTTNTVPPLAVALEAGAGELSGDTLAELLQAGTGVTLSRGGAGGVVISSTGGGAPSADDLVALLQAGQGVTLTRDGTTGAIIISSTGGGNSTTPTAVLYTLPPVTHNLIGNNPRNDGDYGQFFENVYRALGDISFDRLRFKSSTVQSQTHIKILVGGALIAEGDIGAANADGWCYLTLSSAISVAAQGTFTLRLSGGRVNNFSGFYPVGGLDTSTSGLIQRIGGNVALAVAFERTFSQTKNVVGPLDPADFPVASIEQAVPRSGFMLVNDVAKTASLVWKFSDGSTKKLDLT